MAGTDWDSIGSAMYSEMWNPLWTLLNPIKAAYVSRHLDTPATELEKRELYLVSAAGFVVGQSYVITKIVEEIVFQEILVVARIDLIANMIGTVDIVSGSFNAGSVITKTSYTPYLWSDDVHIPNFWKDVKHNENCCYFSPLYRLYNT